VTLFLIAEENEKGSKDSHNPASTAAATTKRTKADATYNIYVAFFKFSVAAASSIYPILIILLFVCCNIFVVI